MDEYILTDEIYDKMNREYARLLPMVKNVLSGKPPFLLQDKPKGICDDEIMECYRDVYTLFYNVSTEGYSPVTRVILALTEMISSEYKLRFKATLERKKTVPSPADAFLSATKLHLASATPMSAVMLSACALILR